MPSNSYEVTITQPAAGPVEVVPAQLPVQGVNVGDTIQVTFIPGTQTQITSITGFPSGVIVSGPNALGQWTASYGASSISSIWTYYISALHITGLNRSDRHDPEIDNTPPG